MENNSLKVMVVDDDRSFREAIVTSLEQEPDIQIVASVHSGQAALDFIAKHDVDILTLDVEMPGLDGLETVRRIHALNKSRPKEKQVGVIMLSATTRRGADITIRSLESGAFDFIAKPVGELDQTMAFLRNILVTKLRHFASFRSRLSMLEHVRQTKAMDHRPAVTWAPPPEPRLAPKPPEAIAIGISTGGPVALLTLIPRLTTMTELPLFIVQHMPAGFTKPLAERLDKGCEKGTVVEAEEHMAVKANHVYIAPGGRHMLVRKTPAGAEIHLSDGPPENNCRPAVDILFRSVAACYGAAALGVIMTGMGSDGTAGAKAMRRAGARIIAQDETSSVVWGMPRSAVKEKIVDCVASLDEMAEAIARYTR